VLDIGGGPGRYSFYLAERGCDVTLFDLSDENITFAADEAKKRGVPLNTIQGDAREIDTIVNGIYDHILLMGPLYHLPDEADRIKTVNAALNLLKQGGTVFVSFISSHAGMIYLMKNAPQLLAATPLEKEFMNLIIEDQPFSGVGFTENYFIRQKDVLPFMGQFPLEKLHFFGQEGILSPCEQSIISQPEEVYEKWLYLAEKLCEREEFISWAEHLMYVGRKL